MIQKLFNTYVFLYVMGGLCAIGILIKLCLFLGYRSFIKASDSVSASKKRWMKQMKMKFETCYQLKIGVNNVDVFVDKYVSKRKFCGLLLSTWENISGQMITLCLLTASCAGILGIVYDCGKDIVLFTFLMGAVGSILVIIVDNVVNISAHKKIMFLNLKDYFENYLKVRLEREFFYPEELNQYRREFFNSVSESKLEMASAKEANVVKPELRSPNIKVINSSTMTPEKALTSDQTNNNETSNKVSKRQERKAAKFTKKEIKKAGKLAKKAEKITRKEAKEASKLITKSERVLSKRSKKDDKLSKKAAKKESKLMKKLSNHEAIEKEKQERIDEKAHAKQTRLAAKKEKEDKIQQEKEEKLRSKQEKELSQQKAYQLKMRLKEEKEIERKEMEQRKAEEALKEQEEEKLEKSNELINGIKASEAVSIHTNETKDLDKTVKNSGERKTEEDKLIEEVLREFLA